MSATLYLIKPEYDLFNIPSHLSGIRDVQLQEASRALLREMVNRYDENWVASGVDAGPFANYVAWAKNSEVWGELLEDSLYLTGRIVLNKNRDGEVVMKLFAFCKEAEAMISVAPYVDRELNVLEITNQEQYWMKDVNDGFPSSLQIPLFNWANKMKSLSTSNLRQAAYNLHFTVDRRLNFWFATQYSAFLRDKGETGVSGYIPDYDVCVDNRAVLPLAGKYEAEINSIRDFLLSQRENISISFD